MGSFGVWSMESNNSGLGHSVPGHGITPWRSPQKWGFGVPVGTEAGVPPVEFAVSLLEEQQHWHRPTSDARGSMAPGGETIEISVSGTVALYQWRWAPMSGLFFTNHLNVP